MTSGEDPGAPSEAPDVGAGGLPIGGLHAALSLICGGLAFALGFFMAFFGVDDEEWVVAVVSLVVAAVWFGAFAFALPQGLVSRVAAGIGVVAAFTAVCGLCGVVM